MSAFDPLRALAWHQSVVRIRPKKGSPVAKPHGSLIDNNLHPANEEAMRRHGDSFADAHLDAIGHYKDGDEYYGKHLRGKRGYVTPDERQRIKSLHHVTAYPLPAPQLTYRGNQMSTPPLPVGSRVSDRGFVSTSLGTDTPIDMFSKQGTENGAPHHMLFAIHAPAGARAYHLDRHNNSWVGQREVLLHPNTHFQVVGHSTHPNPDDDYGHRIHLTHLAVTGQGKANSLTSSPEGKAWLQHVRKNHVGIVTGEAK